MSEITFNTFKKYNFNHGDDEDSATTMSEVLGLPEGFADDVIKTMRIAEIENKKHSQNWEDTFNKMLPQNAMEAFFIGWTAARMYEANQPSPLSMLAKLLRED